MRVWKNLKGFALPGLLLVLFALPAHPKELAVTIKFSVKDLTITEHEGFHLVQLTGCQNCEDAGFPWLPSRNAYVALPGGVTVDKVEVADLAWSEVPGNYDVLPTPMPQRVHDQEEPLPPGAALNSTFKALGLVYPDNPVILTHQADLAGVQLAGVQIYPLRYLPYERKLLFHKSIEFTVHYHDGRESVEAREIITDRGRFMLEQMLETMPILNPEAVQIPAPPPKTTGGTATLPPGYYEEVIITVGSYVSAFQPLADWKTKKGVPTNIVTLSWIQGIYGGNENTHIRDFIKNAVSQWGTLWVLIGGDQDKVPCWETTYSSVDPSPFPHDTYYGDYDGDKVYEVNVGRISAANSTQINSIVNKILNFEKNPALSGYHKKIGLFGFDLDWRTFGENLLEYLSDNVIPGDWTRQKVYDSHGTNHETAVKNNINAGVILAAHIDHGDTSYIGTGITNHNWYITNSEAGSFTNSTKPNTMNSIACLAGRVTAYCFAEAYTRNANGGGLAFIGNGGYGWYSPGSHYPNLSSLMQLEFFKSFFDYGVIQLGKTVAHYKNRNHPGQSNVMKYIWDEVTLFGEPETPVWTESPGSITVTHPSEIYTRPADFLVTVENGGSPVAGAVVCLKKEGDVYEVKSTDASGSCNIVIVPGSVGTLDVTATGQNLLPYEGTCTVVYDGGSYPPTVTSVSPGQGPENGGTSVTVYGTNFAPGITVEFGGNPATNVKLQYTTQLTCKTPVSPSGPGLVDVTAITSYGSGTLIDGFEYTPHEPVVSEVDPDEGRTYEQTFVTITGGYFTTTEQTQVLFGSNYATGVDVINSSTLTCYTPTSSEGGYVDVTVVNNYGSGTLEDGFYYLFPPPEIYSLTPNEGPKQGGNLVTVTGDYFCDPIYVFFGILMAGEITCIDRYTITCCPPGGSGAVDVLVMNTLGEYNVLIEGYTYYDTDPPSVSGVTPNYGHVLGGDTVTITGSNFTTTEDTDVKFGSSSALWLSVIDSNTIEATTPPHSEECVNVTVTNTYGSGTLPWSFHYLDKPVLFFLGGAVIPGSPVAFRVRAPDRPNENLCLIVNNKLGPTNFPNLGITIDLALNGIQVKYNSFGGGPTPDLNDQGERTCVVNVPGYPPGLIYWQVIVGRLSPADLEVSNRVDLEIPE